MIQRYIHVCTAIVMLALANTGMAQKRVYKDSISSSHLVTLHIKDSTVGHIVRIIANQANRTVVCDIDHPLFARRISVNIQDASIMEAYAIALKGTGLVAESAPDGKTVMVYPSKTDTNTRVDTTKGNGRVSGRIVDSSSKVGIEGVIVSIAGTMLTATTQSNGAFSISPLPIGTYRLSMKRLGYRSETVSIHVVTGESVSLRVALQPATTTLSEIITTATGAQERIKIGNDIAKVNVPEVLRNAPVTTMSELLTNRVPGVIVQKTSGAPGSPSVIRIRGMSSLSLNNDPIIIVDGIRIYSTITDPSDGSPIPGGGAPSVLDGIDPNSVETIEVLRGPSAAALYGTDAANGIIVITTKRGQTGPARWRASTQQGINYLPGKYPLMQKLWGHDIDGTILQCATVAVSNSRCTAYDSTVSFQILNDDRTTLFGRGSMQNYSFSVDGGAQTLLYAFTLSTGSNIGYQKLPDSERDRLHSLTGLSIPDWQRRPNRLSQMGGSSRVSVVFNSNADMALTSSISRQIMKTTPLVEAISHYFYNPDPSDSLTSVNIAPDFRTRGEARTTNARLALNAQWRPLMRLRLSGDLGWDRTDRDDESLLKRGDCPSCGGVTSHPLAPQHDLGVLNSLKGTDDIVSFNVRGSLDLLNWWQLSGPTALGINYTQSSKNHITIKATELAAGANSFIGANELTPSNVTNDARVAGVYIDQRIGLFNKFYTGFGLRMDAGSGLGTNASLPAFPKLDFSIPIVTSEAWNNISMLRIRTAFGHSGKQPSITQRLRTYRDEQLAFDENLGGIGLSTIGNTILRPERSVELEGGIDIGIWDSRLELNLTAYRKMTKDMLVSIDVPPSVHGGYTQQRNLGNVLNTGMNAMIVSRVLDRSTIQWDLRGSIYANRNKLVSVNQDMKGTGAGGISPSGGGGTVMETVMNVVGYPLNGAWYRPLIAFEDENGDGILSLSELRYADSAVYLGSNLPKFDGNFGTTFSFYRGKIRLQSLFNYQYGQLQQLLAFNASQGSLSKAILHHTIANDTLSSMYDRALLISKALFINTLSTLRWSELSISMLAFPEVSNFLGVRTMTVTIQGQNLGLWSNYSGLDPNVRARNSEAAVDNGQLPPSRSWIIRIDISR